MAKCAYCEERKGRRACPALGSICTLCCGKHRQTEIACPAECEFLPDPFQTTQRAIDRWQPRILAHAMELDKARGEDGTTRYFGDRPRELADWEQPCFMAWLAYGHERQGVRAVDEFLAQELSQLDREAVEGLRALAQARCSLFEIQEVERDQGLKLVDLLIEDEPFFVRERLGTRTARPGRVLVAWVVSVGGRHVFSGALAHVPPAHVLRTERGWAAALTQARAERPEAPLTELTGRVAVAGLKALREAVLDYVPQGVDPLGRQLAPSSSTWELRDKRRVVEKLLALADFVPDEQSSSFVWLGPSVESPPPTSGSISIREDGVPVAAHFALDDQGRKRLVLGQVFLRTVRLTLECFTRETLAEGRAMLETALGTAIRHCFDREEELAEHMARVKPSRRSVSTDAGAPTPLVLEGARSQEEIQDAIERWVAKNPQEAAFLAEAAQAERQSDRGAPEHSDAGPARPPRPEVHRLSPLPHERVFELDPGLSQLTKRLVRDLRSQPDWESRTLDPEALSRVPTFQEFVKARALELAQAGHDREAIKTELAPKIGHLHYCLNHELHHRKTFWVDAELAWPLHETELDVPGELFRLPFPAQVFVFDDPLTLELGRSLLEGDAFDPPACDPAQVAVYVIRGLEREEGTDVRFAFVFDGDNYRWPYLLARDLYVRPADRLEAILDSRSLSGETEPVDPVFRAPEMRRLVHLALNSALYATSAHLDPVLLPPSGRRRKQGGGASRGGGGGPRRSTRHYSDDDAFHLPGTIDVGKIRRLAELSHSESGRTLLRRFMVRGHWRRAAAGWSDQRLRWIEPYWKGPDLAMIIERDYLLRP